MDDAAKEQPYTDAELENVRKNVASYAAGHYDPEGCVRNYGRLIATIAKLNGELSKKTEALRRIADASRLDECSEGHEICGRFCIDTARAALVIPNMGPRAL